jgi:PmbA protein
MTGNNDQNKLKALAIQAAAAAERAGADAADAYLTRGRTLSIDVYQGKPELFESAGSAGAGIRAFRAGRLGYAYTTDLSEAGLAAAATLAYKNASSSDPDEFNGLPETAAKPLPSSEDLRITSLEYGQATTSDKIEFALRVEKTALAADARVKGCESVTYGEEDETVALANTAGFAGAYERQACYAFADCLAEEKGEVQTGFSYGVGRHLGDLDAIFTGQEAAERAVAMLGGRQAQTATLTAVFDPLVFVQVLAAITPALSAEAAQKGRSFLADEVGKVIASPLFTLVDDGRLPAGMGTAPFDDDGVQTGAHTVFDAGTLKTLLFNTYSARAGGVASTGNARRGSFRSVPGTSPTNMFVQPGVLSRDDIIGGVEDGIYIMGLQGLHAGVSPITGQFSAGAYGLRIKSGRLAEPVREVTIASTCAAILKNVSAVGADIRYVPMGASLGSPTIAVDNMVLSGR